MTTRGRHRRALTVPVAPWAASAMGLLRRPVELVQYGRRAMKVVAMADRTFDDRERAVMRAACDALEVKHDVDAVIGIDPEELGEPLRKRLIAGLRRIDTERGRERLGDKRPAGRVARALPRLAGSP
jgi:hypothetical protein